VKVDAEKTNIRIGVTVVLFDTSRAEKLLGYDTLKRLVSTQLRDADIIALNKVDMAPKEKIEQSRAAVHLVNPHAEIIRLSNRTGEGVQTIAQAVRDITVNA
jgi:G3E family GTPase